jgi:hypothetical protein
MTFLFTYLPDELPKLTQESIALYFQALMVNAIEHSVDESPLLTGLIEAREYVTEHNLPGFILDLALATCVNSLATHMPYNFNNISTGGITMILGYVLSAPDLLLEELQAPAMEKMCSLISDVVNKSIEFHTPTQLNQALYDLLTPIGVQQLIKEVYTDKKQRKLIWRILRKVKGRNLDWRVQFVDLMTSDEIMSNIGRCKDAEVLRRLEEHAKVDDTTKVMAALRGKMNPNVSKRNLNANKRNVRGQTPTPSSHPILLGRSTP